MRMSIDEIILTEKEIAENFQRTVDTHMVSGDMSLEELYCDDTEIIEEELKRCQGLADFHNQIVDTMRNYQKIQETIKSEMSFENAKFTVDNLAGLSRALEIFEEAENGNDD